MLITPQYAFFFSYPVVFIGNYHWSEGIAGLTFISVWIGLAGALFVTPRLERNYRARMVAKGGKADPEDRLVGMMVGSVWVPICTSSFSRSCSRKTLKTLSSSALFIFGWTSPPAVMPGGGNWVGPVSSGIPFGFGSTCPKLAFASETRSLIDLASPSSSHRIVQRIVVTIYFSANAYIIDAFPGYVASALAAKTVVRSGAGAAMPLFITAMYHNLGNGWAASTWAFVSLAMVRNTSSLRACVRY